MGIEQLSSMQRSPQKYSYPLNQQFYFYIYKDVHCSIIYSGESWEKKHCVTKSRGLIE